MRMTFYDVVFDSDQRSVARLGVPLHLSPKAFDLLGLLIAERPRVVRKEEIVEALWPQLFVEEANVRSLIAEIHAAVGDEAGRAIVTLPTVGYAFREEPKRAATSSQYMLIANGKEFPLDRLVTVVGRGEDCGVIALNSGVSHHHFRITLDGGGAFIEDLESKNGTWVNGKRLAASEELRDGDEISAGRAVMQFRRTGTAEATTTLNVTGL